MSPTQGIFELGSGVYDFLTDQDYWRDQITRMLDHAQNLPASPRVLDLGCGPGVSTFILARALGARAQIIGIDYAEQMIERARRHLQRRHSDLTGVRFERADARSLPFPEASFDLAVGHSFLYLVPARETVLREVHRTLAPGGSLVLMEPNAEGSLFEAARRASRRAGELLTRPSAASRFAASMIAWRVVSAWKGRMSPALIRDLFEGAGFRDVRTEPTLGGLGLHCIGRA